MGQQGRPCEGHELAKILDVQECLLCSSFAAVVVPQLPQVVTVGCIVPGCGKLSVARERQGLKELMCEPLLDSIHSRAASSSLQG